MSRVTQASPKCFYTASECSPPTDPAANTLVLTILRASQSRGNHNNIFGVSVGLELRKYRYYHPKTRGLDYQGLIEDLSQAPYGAVVVLHACAHNPTGVDPTMAQWQGILQVVQERKLLPFFDSAYQVGWCWAWVCCAIFVKFFMCKYRTPT